MANFSFIKDGKEYQVWEYNGDKVYPANDIFECGVLSDFFSGEELKRKRIEVKEHYKKQYEERRNKKNNKQDPLKVHIKSKQEVALPEITESTITMSSDWKFRPTDLCNSEMFSALAEGHVLYVPELKAWFYYNGKKWTEDKQRVEVEKICVKVIQALYALSAAAQSESERKMYAAWALKSEDESRRRAMVAGAERMESLVKHLSEFDKNPYLYNVQNGTINLKTGELLPHNQNDYLMKIASCEFDPDAKCPLWLQILDTALSGDKELINFYHKYSGYTLAGDTSEQTILFLYGSQGANGKSTITKAEENIQGDYACRIGIDTLLSGKRNPGGPSEDIARLTGIRRATVSEPPENGRWNDALLKDLSGGDSINARHLHAKSFDFTPQVKLVIFGNHKPRLSGSSGALRRRFRLINFQHKFNNPDRTIPDKLKAEYPGILNWMVQGCLKWQMEGLGEPVSVRNETDKYFYDNNELQQFIDENFSFTMNEKDKIKFKDFYDEFVEFSGTKVSKSKFANILRDEFNFEIKSGKGNQREIFKIIRKVEVTDNNRIVTEVESWDDLHPAENLF